MGLSGCGQICKWIIILFNILFILVGLALVGGGTYLCITGPVDLKTKYFIFVMALCIGVGIIIILAAAAGDYGSCYENKSALSSYGALLTLLFLAAIIGGIASYVNNREFSSHVSEFYATIYAQYLVIGDGVRAFILKVFHNVFDCCGLGGAVQTLMGSTNLCPQETSILGIPVSTSSSCLPVITGGLQASSTLYFFLGIAGVLLVTIVCSSFIWQQLSRPPPVSPAYIPLSSSSTSYIPVVPTFYSSSNVASSSDFHSYTIPPPSSSSSGIPPLSPPPYKSVIEDL
ncbi:CD81 protein-like isoform X2 [Trichomycterus rosablanca]